MPAVFPKKPKSARAVYLDHAAATPVDQRVVKAMAPYWNANFANPSALYSSGQKIRGAVQRARQTIADILFTHPDCITFTSGGTESNNLAIAGVVQNLKSKIKNQKSKIHIITTAIEHHSVLSPIKELEKNGAAVSYLPVDRLGQIKTENVMRAIRPETKLISIMYANNEIGTINPIAEIGRELLKYRQKNKTLYPYFHTDACQAAGALDLHTERLHVDLMTINGSKIYGPKGSGLLFVRRGVPLAPIIFGGGQEIGLRSGTENVPGIIGLAKALELAQNNRERENTRLTKLRDYFIQKMCATIPDCQLNGPTDNRLANNVNIRFGGVEGLALSGVEGENVVLYLDAYGISAATGSACAAESVNASHVLTACGLNRTEAKSSVRFTLGRATTKSDVDYVLKFLPGIIKGLRAAQKLV